MSFTSGQILTASQLNTFDPSTKITNAGGTSSAPSYTFNSDEDTGMYRRSANQLAFAVEGTLAAYFDKVTDGGRFIGPGQATGTSIIRPNAGSASNPTYTFYGDEDTGLLRSAADTIGLATGGTQVVTISSDGRLGVGDTSPSATLHVNAAAANTTAVFESTDAEAYIGLKDNSSGSDLHVAVAAIGNDLALRAGNDNVVRIKDDGDVGIGTTSPGGNLQVVSQNRAFTVIDSGTSNIAEAGFTSLGGDGPAFGRLSGYDIDFLTGTTRSGLATAMHIDNDSKVGIGTTTPSAHLHVNSGATNTAAVFESTDAGALIGLKDDSTTGISYVGLRATGDNLLLRAGNSNHVEVKSDGDVDIATGNVTFEGSGKTVVASNPQTGTGNDAEWVLFGNYILSRNSSLAAEKENISADLGTHLTADMIDSVVPKMWNRITAPGYPEIGPIAEEMDAISPFLAAHGTTAEGEETLTGINKTGYLSLLVLAVKDLRTRVAALESA